MSTAENWFLFLITRRRKKEKKEKTTSRFCRSEMSWFMLVVVTQRTPFPWLGGGWNKLKKADWLTDWRWDEITDGYFPWSELLFFTFFRLTTYLPTSRLVGPTVHLLTVHTTWSCWRARYVTRRLFCPSRSPRRSQCLSDTYLSFANLAVDRVWYLEETRRNLLGANTRRSTVNGFKRRLWKTRGRMKQVKRRENIKGKY